MLRNASSTGFVLVRPQCRDFGQTDFLAGEVFDRLGRVGEAVLDPGVLANRLGRLAEAMVNLAQDVDRLPAVFGLDHPARLLVLAFHLGHLLAGRQGLGVLAEGEVAEADRVPVAFDKAAVGIARRRTS